MSNKVIILSGVSGAGKSTVSNILEDMGYHCIDQLPTSLVDGLLEYIAKGQDARLAKLVLTTNLYDFSEIFQQVKNAIPDVVVVLVDASKEVLVNRYMFTRRIHPLLIQNKADTLDMAIDLEKEMLSKVINDSVVSIDTSSGDTKELKKRLESIEKIIDEVKLSLSFESFGFKYGISKTADYVIDVRLLDNPFYEEELKELTGEDDRVYSYVIDKPNAKAYLKKITDLLDYSIESYLAAGKRHLTIAVGCTGGRHRSVSVACFLYKYYKDKYNSFLRHRDIEK